VLRRGAVSAVGIGLAMAMMFTGSAAAATVVGSECASSTTAPSVSVVSLKNPAGYPLPSAIPSAGVITSWTFSVGGVLPPELQVSEKLKVFAPTDVPGQLEVVGESPATTILGGVTTTPVRIPVQGGDLLGSSLTVLSKGKLEAGAIFCKTEDPGDEVAFVPEDPPTGATVSLSGNETGFQNAVTVSVEPDADGDGYGDETQDKCPTDASTHEACPAPAVSKPAEPITLSASAAARKGLVTVTLTSTAQATVTVGGTVRLGKGKTAKLGGGTQIVAPGTLAKFTILFPAKMKAALKQLPTTKKLTLSLAASAPGATTKELTVKVPGQEKPRPHHKSRG
jgi:hypothetical protein